MAGRTKEIKLRANTGGGDVKRKAEQASKFLADGDRVLVSIRLRGRENAHPELAMGALAYLTAHVEGGSTERAPTLVGNTVTMLLAPQKGRRKA